MGRFVHDEHVRIWCGASVASVTAPTTTEIAALTELTTFVPPDGLKRGAKSAKVSNADLTTRYDNEIMGSYGNALELMCFEDDGSGSDTALTLFATPFQSLFLVIRRKLLYTTAAAAGQKCEVYPVQTGQVEYADTARDTRVLFKVPLAVTSKPGLAAVMA